MAGQDGSATPLSVSGQRAAAEYADAGIRVNAVGSGLIRTEGAAKPFGPDPAGHARRVSYLPLGRLGEADDIAGVIAFLCSPEARRIIGQALYAAGRILLQAVPAPGPDAGTRPGRLSGGPRDTPRSRVVEPAMSGSGRLAVLMRSPAPRKSWA
jgi:hypothetical protein